MDIAHLRRSCSSIGGQRRAAADLDAGVRTLITPAAAIGFGVVPLDTDGATVAFGAVPDINPACAGALSSLLGKQAALIPFDDSVAREAITHHYLRADHGASQGLDLATFESPDFLADPVATRRLMSEKDGALPERDINLPPGHVALLDVRLHSVLKSLDRARRVEFTASPSAIPFRAEDDGAVLFREESLPPKTHAIVAQSLFYDGDEHLHVLRGHDLSSLPHVLHPSEVQLAELDGDQARFWVYDGMQAVRATATRPARPAATWTCRYYFLHFGARFMRTLRLDVLSFMLVKRTKLRTARRSDRLVPSDLQRIFGLDFPRA